MIKYVYLAADKAIRPILLSTERDPVFFVIVSVKRVLGGVKGKGYRADKRRVRKDVTCKDYRISNGRFVIKVGVRDNAAEIIIFQLRLLVNLISFS